MTGNNIHKIENMDVITNKTSKPLIIDFDNKATKQLKAFLEIEGQPMPENLTKLKLLNTWHFYYQKINRELIHHRQEPINSDRLKKLKELIGMDVLPKATEEILKSIS